MQKQQVDGNIYFTNTSLCYFLCADKATHRSVLSESDNFFLIYANTEYNLLPWKKYCT